jgi:DNA-binding transcriptional LysR family regulator
MQLRLLEYFVAVAREGHFARAACNVSQPTLSSGIASLEEALGRRLVERDRRFIGLTAAGRVALPWAQQIVSACHGLAIATHAERGVLRGQMRLGAIPASLPMTGLFADALVASHPEVEVSIRSLTSREITSGLAAFELDAGLTYIDHEPPAHVLSVPIYAERMMYVGLDTPALAARDRMPWAEVLDQPLCLLHQGMQNRRILDAFLARQGLAARPKATADSYVALLAMLRHGHFATIMPDSYVPMMPGWARVLPFDVETPASRIGLVVADRGPLGGLAHAALAIAEQLRA